jgi:hypothetical protein
MDSNILQSDRIEVDDDVWAVNDFFEEKGWTDGLPIIPPTEERVGQMLAAVQHSPQDVIGAVPPRWARATVEKIAINAVMAGCLPQYMPVLIAAAEALTDPKLNLYSLQATTGGPAIMLIVNGPIRKTAQYQWWFKCSRRRLAGQCHDRPLRSPDPAKHRRFLSRNYLQGDIRLAGQIQSLHRGERRSEPMGAFARGARIRTGHEHSDSDQRG